MEKTTIQVGGMSCQGCVRNIEGVLSALTGVISAEVILENGEAHVSFEAQQIDRCALLAAIEDAGFDAA